MPVTVPAGSATVTVVEGGVAGSVLLAVPQATQSQVTIELDNPSASDITVDVITLDGNIGAPSDPARREAVGMRYTADGNFYGDNRMAAQVPFDLGGTVQTDWGGNVGY